MRRSLAPSQRNKNLGNPLSKFKSPLLKSTSRPILSTLNKNDNSITNNITKLKTKIFNQTDDDNIEKKEENKENEDIKENKLSNSVSVNPPPAKKIKLSNYKRPLFTKKTPQLLINKEKIKCQESEEKSERKLYYNVVWRKKTTKKK